MREILTIAGASLVAILTAALAVPPFIDWNAHRDALEARLSAATGATIKLPGALKVRLLPAPRLETRGFALAGPGLSIEAEDAEFELSPTALLRGAWRLDRARLSAPRIVVDPALWPDGRGSLKFSLGDFTLREAQARLAGPHPLVIEHLDAQGATEGLAGPTHAQGEMQVGGRRLKFSLTTAPDATGATPLKLSLQDALAGVSLDVAGDLRMQGRELAFAGSGVAQGDDAGVVRAPWRATFAGLADASSVRAEKMALKIGDDDHALSFDGSGGWSEADGARFDLAARMADLDAFSALYNPQAARFGASLKVHLGADTATLGGQTLGAVSVEATLTPGARPHVVLHFDAPGGAHVDYDGAASFDSRDIVGRLAFSARDTAAFSQWFGGLSGTAPIAYAGPARFSGLVARANGDLGAQGAEMQFGALHFSGDVAWRVANRDKPLLAARIAAPALDLETAPDLAALRGGAFDADVTIDAQTATFGVGGATRAGRIFAHALRRDGALIIEKLSIADLGGANLEGSGRAVGDDALFDVNLDAARLGDLAALARRLAPGVLTDLLVARAAALSPAKLSFTLRSGARGLEDARASGLAGGTNVDARYTQDVNGARFLDTLAIAPDVAVLLRQLGAPAALPLRGFGRGRIFAQARGAATGPLRLTGEAQMKDAQIEFSGALDSGDALSGDVTLAAQNLAPLLQILALRPLDALGGLAGHGAARLSATDGLWSFAGLDARIGGTHWTGALEKRAGAPITGTLSADQLAGDDVVALLTGPAPPARAGSVWSDLKFAPQMIEPPTADVELSVQKFSLGALSAEDMHGRLKMAADRIGLSDSALHVAGGTLKGEATMRRAGGVVSLEARFKGDDLALSAGPLAARVSGDMAFSGAGGSAAELVGALAGEGRADWREGAVDGASPQGLAQAIATIEQDATPFEAKAVAATLTRGLDQGSLRFAETGAPARLAAGVLTLGDAAQGPVANIDLRTLQLEAKAQVRPEGSDKTPENSPAVEVAYRGPVRSALTRRVDADALFGFLAMRAGARERARAAAFEADVRERSFFNRRLKISRRIDEERRYAAEQKRRAEEARAEAERAAQKAQETPAAPLPPPRPPAAFSPTRGDHPPDPASAGRY
ncbi:MAG: AsmA family protein [Hyphomicrobiales bacterium]|nr:AsmA family protein [Hyphomicrobiales bacterium]